MNTNSFQQDVMKSVEAISDRITAADLELSSKTITITSISFFDDVQEKEGKKITSRRARFHYAGENGKPYVPCKTLIKFIYEQWGVPENELSYNGRLLEIYNDPTVKLGKITVGGVRLKAMSHIPEAVNQRRKSGRSTMVIQVQPIETKKTFTPEQINTAITKYTQQIKAITDITQITDWLAGEKYQWVKNNAADRITEIDNALQQKQNELNGV